MTPEISLKILTTYDEIVILLSIGNLIKIKSRTNIDELLNSED